MEMADVIVIFRPGCCERFDDEALAESFAATNVDRPTEGAVSCTIPMEKFHDVERHPSVAYLRRIQAYMGSADS